jgi:hypothetical protein
MSYLDADDPRLLEDINARKEFLELREAHGYTEEPGIIPYYMLKHELAKKRYLRLKSYQLFVSNFMNPDTPYTRLMVKHDMGVGKTITAISVAMRFIEIFKLNSKRAKENAGWVYVIGFTRAQFERDLFRFTELGFITRQEQEYVNKLMHYSQLGAESDIKAFKEYYNKLRRRLGSGKGNGFFKFIGYRELANRIFMTASGVDVNTLSETDIYNGLANKTIEINTAYVAQFRNNLIICDEVHNTYNALAKNNWGIAIQIILNEFGPDVRGLFLSGTILKNSQTESIDVINLLRGSRDKMYKRADFFDSNDNLLPGALEEISHLTKGRISFLVDVNPALYPTYTFMGEPIISGSSQENSRYLRFERCPMAPLQQQTYDRVADDINVLHEQSYLFDMVFPRPPGGRGHVAAAAETPAIFRVNELRHIDTAPAQWKASLGLSVDMKEKTINGHILEKANMRAYSSKYTRMIDLLDEIMASGGGKVFIYHKFLHMSGALLIGHILSANGLVASGVPPSASTKCALCGLISSEHKPDAGHIFAPARYIVVHGELDKRTMTQMLDRYNERDNTTGDKIMVIIGSRVMKEAHDLMAIRHIFVISRPDNISSLLQIIKRGIRAGSHQHLPEDKHNVRIYIFTAKSNKPILSYEEDRYLQKIRDYVIIQHIERAIHMTAIDAYVNRKTIEPALVEDTIGHLKYDPPPMKVADMNTTTFDIFYKQREVNDIIYVIKRLFMERSKVWGREDLWTAVQSPSFEFEYDTRLFSRESFVVALHLLVWNNDCFGETQDEGGIERRRDVFDVLFNPYDKQILLDGRTLAVIVAVGEYLIAFPLDAQQRPRIETDSPFRMAEPTGQQTYSITGYIRTALSRQRYMDLKLSFMKKYEGKSVSEMTDAICEHGHDFHVMLAEEVIMYIFDLWTDPKMVASKEYNAFYFQMLYFYDTHGLVVWMNSAQRFIRDMYADFEKMFVVNDDASSVGIIPKGYKPQDRGDLIYIARTIERSGCSWCPNTTKTRFDAAIAKSKMRFAKLKTATTGVSDDMIPIGHVIDEVARFYHPMRGWFSSPEYSKKTAHWKENDIIIGFDQRSTGGLHIRFRLRGPRHKIKHHKDARLIERGIICTSRSKPYLVDIAKKLGIKGVSEESNLQAICREIRARLLYLELAERAKGTNIKYFYNQFEDGSAID